MRKTLAIIFSLSLSFGFHAPAEAITQFISVTVSVPAFTNAQTELSISQKTNIKSTLAAHPDAEVFNCQVAVTNKYSNAQKIQAKKRAASVCEYISSQAPYAITESETITVSSIKGSGVQIKISKALTPLDEKKLYFTSSHNTYFGLVTFAFGYLGDLTDLAVQKWCFANLDASNKAPVFTHTKLGELQTSLDQDNCITTPNGGVSGSIVVDTTKFPDSIQNIAIYFEVKDGQDRSWRIQKKVSFDVRNNSLEARAPIVSLTGQAVAGETLIGLPGTWDAGVVTRYKWFVGGTEIYGANSTTYLLTGNDVGATVSFAVVASNSSNEEFTKFSAASLPVAIQGSYPSSDFKFDNSQTTFNVKETSQKYNSLTGKYDTVTVNNYNVNLSHPSSLACASYSCEVSVKASWSGLFDSYEYFITTVYLVDASTGVTIDTDSIYLSGGTTATDDLSFSVSRAGTFRLKITSASYGQTLSDSGWSNIVVVKSPNSTGALTTVRNDAMATVQLAEGRIYSGTSSSVNWYLWEYKVPQSVNVVSKCMALPVYLAPLSLATGQVGDWSTNSWSDAEISVTDSLGSQIELIKINGSYGGWTNIVKSDRVDIKVCGLNSRQGSYSTLNLNIKLRYDSFNLENTYNLNQKISLYGNLKYSKINCFSGDLGMTIDDYQPVCPTGWTKTIAPVTNGKVKLTTINCLSGTDVVVVKHPEPKCPAGYKTTDLQVRNGKLVPWTITCVKGLLVKKVTNIFPSCPSGYTRK